MYFLLLYIPETKTFSYLQNHCTIHLPNILHCRNQRKVASEEDVWELKFDVDEMQELLTMSTHPYVKGLLLSLVDELQNRMKNVRCDLAEKLSAVQKWSNVVAGRSTCRKEGSNRNLESNITSHTTEEPWMTVNRGHKKPPSVNHATYHN